VLGFDAVLSSAVQRLRAMFRKPGVGVSHRVTPGTP
jgi:hypothetical protein